MDRREMKMNFGEKGSAWLPGAKAAVFGAIGIFSMLGLASTAGAALTGVCSDCHTMHNSQNSADFGTNDATPDGALTIGDCVACHSGTEASSINAGGNIPRVFRTDAEPTTLLAGGNFYWVADSGGDSDAKGHNVVGIAGKDGSINDGGSGFTPPGWSADTMFVPAMAGSAAVAGGAASWDTQLTCAGTYGCHGKHASADDFTDISGAHHGIDTTIDGSTLVKSYRFLAGIDGKESATWAVASNRYQGAVRAGDESGDIVKTTISYLCAECHGKFHSGAGTEGVDSTWGSAWLRHPVDFDMFDATGAEYSDYVYDDEAPVAVLDPEADTPSFADGKAIVTCISCHYAHGSANNDLLRWSYSTMNITGASKTTGCFRCHTTKDTGV